MNSPPLCLKNLSCIADFAHIESSIEAISLYFTKDTRDSIYALLWELGSNILKYGTQSIIYSSAPMQIYALRYKHYIEIIVLYQIPYGCKNFSLIDSRDPSNVILFDVLDTRTSYINRYAHIYTTPKLESNLLGEKVIWHIARNFCYDMPKIFITSALCRKLQVRIKGEYFEHKHKY